MVDRILLKESMKLQKALSKIFTECPKGNLTIEEMTPNDSGKAWGLIDAANVCMIIPHTDQLRDILKVYSYKDVKTKLFS